MTFGLEQPALLEDIALRIGMLLAAGDFTNGIVTLATRRRTGLDKAKRSLWPRFRVWTVVAVVVLGADALGTWALGILFGLVAVQAVRELTAALATTSSPPNPLPAILAAIALIAGAAGAGLSGLSWCLVAVVLILPALIAWRTDPEPTAPARIGATLFTALYPGMPLALLVAMRHQPEGFALIAWICTIVALADVTAMFGGMLWGRHAIAPRLSPGKTVEGVAVGVLGAVGGSALLAFALPTVAPVLLHTVAVALAFAGLAGDLFASWIKRATGIKDFGAALPGHGGVMDRLDSLLFAAPVAVVLVLA